MSSGKLYILQYRPGGEIIEMDPDGGNRRTLLGNLLDNVDGIVIDNRTKTLYWTNMGPAIGPSPGEFFQADGSIECVGLNGANRRMLVGHGLTVTPKQVAADFDAAFLYWCDREQLSERVGYHAASRPRADLSVSPRCAVPDASKAASQSRHRPLRLPLPVQVERGLRA